MNFLMVYNGFEEVLDLGFRVFSGIGFMFSGSLCCGKVDFSL